ncbi:MAG: SsrA-binding protein SmpB [Clostridia bacterium]|nr:SsrA-binding protein SmpB [Clostridia bacterium]
MAGAGDNIKIIAQNRKAYHEYFIDDKIECGIVLAGTEVKSLRKGAVNFRDSYAEIRNGECFLCGMHISPYEQGNIFNKDPLRDRKLLLRKSEINRLLGFVKQKGLTLVPLELYFSKGRVKLLLGVARGKKLYDKRDSIAAKDTAREIDRRLKESFRE